MRIRFSKAIRESVARRARFACEYCLLSEAYAYWGCEIEHVISLKHGGSSDLDNLALACVACNKFKGSDIATITPGTLDLVPLFNPRLQHWRTHFLLEPETALILPKTASGEGTIRILQMNDLPQLEERRSLFLTGRYPPTWIDD